jgi:putative chitinase
MNTDKLIGSVPANVGAYIKQVIVKYKIDKPLRLAHFLSQIAHESGDFKFVAENLNYSSEGLLKTFPKYFKDKATADKYARNPEMIGSRVYASRMGNGDEASKEGFKFRGRGYLQLTGKDNYKAFTTFIGEDCVLVPDLVATKYPMDSAIWFFNKNGLWAICDKGDSLAVITELTKRINGGTHGLDDRANKFKKYKDLLS